MPNPRTKYIPKRCVFEATLACNLRCRHCGSRAGRARPDELTLAEAADLFEQLSELGCRWITISGGEPTVRPDWPGLIGAATRAGIRVGMITNGVTFDDYAACLAREKGLRAVGLSVDGIGQTHDRVRGRIGHFRRVGEAMDSAVRSGLPFAVITHANQLNLGEMEELHDFVLEKGAYAWQVQLGTDMGNMRENRELLLTPKDVVRLERTLGSLVKRSELRIDVSDSIGYFGPFEKQLRESQGKPCFKGCPAGIRVIGVESNGNVKGCLSIMAGYNEEGADFVEGNIREERLADIWHKPGAFAYSREWSVEDLSGFCGDCKHVLKCKGGCRAKIVASGHGTENPMCAYRALKESEVGSRRAGQAAAVILASVLGASTQTCGDDNDDNDDVMDYGMPAYGMDTDIDTDTDADTDTDGDSDTDADTDMDAGTDTDTDVDADSGTDTDSDSDTDSQLSST